MKFLTIGLLAIATLFNISAFAACPTANVTLTTQTEVDDFATTYPGCTVWPVGIKLRITGAGITNLDGLSVLTQLDGKVKVTLTPDLVDITGLMNVTTINSELQFEECIALTSLDGLQNVTTCFRLEIQGMDALTDMSQLSGITSLGSSLAILDCDTLISLNGLQNITSVGGDLRIEQSHLLDDLSALSSLTSVGGSVKILSNKNLTSLTGLDNIVSIGGGLDVKSNPFLADCLGACRMLNVPPPGGAFFSGNLSLQCNDLFILEADCLIALPVELSDFRAKEDTKNQNVAITWITASELNNKHFEVQRSADGRNFENIGIVAGNGTTTKVNSYSFVDARPINVAYYRLKQVDFSGDFTYSDLVLVKMTKTEDAEVMAYPTIANNEITVRFTGFKALQGTFNVFNTQGSLVHSEEVDLSNKMAYKTLNTSKFQTGIYTIVISDNANHISTNFIVVK